MRRGWRGGTGRCRPPGSERWRPGSPATPCPAIRPAYRPARDRTPWSAVNDSKVAGGADPVETFLRDDRSVPAVRYQVLTDRKLPTEFGAHQRGQGLVHRQLDGQRAALVFLDHQIDVDAELAGGQQQHADDGEQQQPESCRDDLQHALLGGGWVPVAGNVALRSACSVGFGDGHGNTVGTPDIEGSGRSVRSRAGGVAEKLELLPAGLRVIHHEHQAASLPGPRPRAPVPARNRRPPPAPRSLRPPPARSPLEQDRACSGRSRRSGPRRCKELPPGDAYFPRRAVRAHRAPPWPDRC